jgi:hypothetical protein
LSRLYEKNPGCKIVSGIYDPNAILKNLSEQDIYFDSKDLIDSKRNAVGQDNQPDSKGKMSSNSFKEEYPKEPLYIIGKECPKSAARTPSISRAEAAEQ